MDSTFSFPPRRLTAVAPSAAERPVARDERHRTCDAAGCETRLSAYNPGSTCWQHEPWRPYVQHAPRKAVPTADDETVLALVQRTAAG